MDNKTLKDYIKNKEVVERITLECTLEETPTVIRMLLGSEWHLKKQIDSKEKVNLVGERLIEEFQRHACAAKSGTKQCGCEG